MNEDFKCPQCGSTHFFKNDKGEIVCSNCGLVVDLDSIDYGPEWIKYDQTEENEERTGNASSFLRHDMGISTTIIYTQNEKNKNKIRKLQMKHNMVIKFGKDHFINALNIIRVVGTKMELPYEVLESAGFICKKIYDGKYLVYHRDELRAAVSLYLAYIIHNIPITIKEFVTLFNENSEKPIRIKLFYRTYRKYIEKSNTSIKFFTVYDYFNDIVKKLKLTDEVIEYARKLLHKLNENNQISRYTPKIVAATLIYLAIAHFDSSMTQAAYCSKVNITEASLRLLIKKLKTILPTAFFS